MIPSTDLSSFHVIVAERDRAILQLYRGQLLTLGIRMVTVAQSSDELQQKLMTARFDAIVLSDTLGPVDALSFTRRMRSRHDCLNRETPVIFISAQAERVFIEKARDSGISEFIRKPVTGDMLRSRLLVAAAQQRDFISAPSYMGPDRRRSQAAPFKPRWERRGARTKLSA